MDNDKKNDLEWNPKDYEIYTLEDDSAEETEEIPEKKAEEKSEVPEKESKPEKKKPEKKDRKSKKDKKPSGPKKEKSKTRTLIFTLITAVIVITALIVILKFFLPENTNGYKIFTNEVTQSAQPTENPNTVRVTFPEGYTVYQYAELLEKNGVCSKNDFYTAVNTPVESIDIQNADDRVFLLEGYLFPDTYDFYKNEPAETVVQRFIDNYNQKVTAEIKQKAESLGYTMDEMLTLASIIQKECDYGIEECRNVSSVFHNRLDASRDTYLGSDVTYFYLKNMADYLGGSDSQKFDDFLMKYYTYSGYRKGLPAGPVCNPGIKAIEAAVSPNDTDYRFFLTDKDGKKFFYAETFEQHQQNYKLAGLGE